MKTITRFVKAIVALFQATTIGAYFAPIFRPMITEQYRLHPIRVVPTPDRASRLRSFLSDSPNERPSQL